MISLKPFPDILVSLYHFLFFFRASKALNEGAPSKDHERTLATVWCDQASVRVQRNLKAISSSRDLKLDSSTREIADQVMENGGTVPQHPLRV